MKIIPEISIGLKRLSNAALVSEKNFDFLITNLNAYFQARNSYHTVDTLASTVKIEVLKETYSALFCFLVECVRKNVEMDSLSSYLESVRFSQDKIDKILSLYVDNKDTIHRKLLYYGIKPCHLTNVSWKMNFCVKSSFSSLEGVSVYYITLDVKDTLDPSGNRKNVTFLCTVQHLQELVSSLRAAVRKIDSIAALSSSVT